MRLALAVAALALAGCKTRLPGFDVDAAVPRDAAVLDLAIPKDNCGVVDIQTTEVIRADLLVLQDRSRSMTESIGGLFGPSKWDVIRGAIEQVVGETRSVDWGLMLFGTSGSSCGAPTAPEVPVGPDTATAIRQTLEATSPSSGTPTTATLRNALAWLQGRQDGQPHYMLLATDGEPRCGPGGGFGGGGGDDSAAAEKAVADAAAAGVKTFVVGIGSTANAQTTLDTMAKNGGVPNTTAGQPAYYSAMSTQELVDVLEKAAMRITSCSYPLGGAPPFPDLVTVEGSQGVIPRDATHTDGWDLVDGDTRVVFYGPACAALQSGVVTDVKAIYFCPDR